MSPTSTTPDTAVALDHVAMLYSALDRPALNVEQLRIAPGEYTAIMGASGSGKSTLLNIIGALDRPTRGHVTVFDTTLDDLNDADLTSLRRHTVSFIFQQFHLIPTLTARENVTTPLIADQQRRSERNHRADRALNHVGLANRADHLPGQLSGGEQQRVAIARALVTRPSLLLADEPTGNLDATTSATILNHLEELHTQRNLTIVVATHDPAVALRAQRVVGLQDGEITAELHPTSDTQPHDLVAELNPPNHQPPLADTRAPR